MEESAWIFHAAAQSFLLEQLSLAAAQAVTSLSTEQKRS
jgi:hypothetical protein